MVSQQVVCAVWLSVVVYSQQVNEYYNHIHGQSDSSTIFDQYYLSENHFPLIYNCIKLNMSCIQNSDSHDVVQIRHDFTKPLAINMALNQTWLVTMSHLSIH